jgi:LPXTG-motif cell wall-anchored protein
MFATLLGATGEHDVLWTILIILAIIALVLFILGRGRF